MGQHATTLRALASLKAEAPMTRSVGDSHQMQCTSVVPLLRKQEKAGVPGVAPALLSDHKKSVEPPVAEQKRLFKGSCKAQAAQG